MKFNKWTLGLAAVGVVSLASAARADESKISQVQTALSDTTISGYVDVAAQFNPNGSSGGYAPNYYYNSNPNSINLNVVNVTINKPLDESPWASGYRVEFAVGPVANSMGLPNNIRQAYVALRTPVGNGIDWKVGIFDTIVGYESTTSGNNPNFSKSYGYNMEPTTHTGILAAYKATDWISMQLGIANASYAGYGSYSANSTTTPYNNQTTGLYRPTFMWGPCLTAPDSFGWAKGATLSIATIVSGGNTDQNGGTSSAGQGAQTYYAGITLPTPIAALKFGAAFDYLAAHDVAANEWAAAVYSTYQFNDKLSLNLRAEYFDGRPLNTAGAYINTPQTPPVPSNGQPPQGYNQAQEITATLQYALWANVLTRLEVRWDHSNSTETGYLSNTGNMQQNAFLLAAQAIYTF